MTVGIYPGGFCLDILSLTAVKSPIFSNKLVFSTKFLFTHLCFAFSFSKRLVYFAFENGLTQMTTTVRTLHFTDLSNTIPSYKAKVSTSILTLILVALLYYWRP